MGIGCQSRRGWQNIATEELFHTKEGGQAIESHDKSNESDNSLFAVFAGVSGTQLLLRAIHEML